MSPRFLQNPLLASNSPATDLEAASRGYVLAAVAGAAGPAPGFWTTVRSGYVYQRPFSALALATPTLNQLDLAPWFFDAAVTISALAFRTSAATASRAVRIGIYADSSGAPGNLVFDSGSVSATSNSTFSTSYSGTLGPGRVWIGAVHQGAVGSAWCENGSPPIILPGVSSTTTFGAVTGAGTATSHYSQTGVTGALPSPFTVGAGAAGLLAIQIKVA